MLPRATQGQIRLDADPSMLVVPNEVWMPDYMLASAVEGTVDRLHPPYARLPHVGIVLL